MTPELEVLLNSHFLSCDGRANTVNVTTLLTKPATSDEKFLKELLIDVSCNPPTCSQLTS
jgi:hypothetical protein